MYGVIVCPRCTMVQGADLNMARITCPRCGHRIDVKRAKVYFSTDSPIELAEGVRRVGERLVYDIEKGRGAAPGPRDERARGGDEQSLRAVVQSLMKGRDALTREDLKEGLGMDDHGVDQAIARMLSAGIIYEASPGHYRPA